MTYQSRVPIKIRFHEKYIWDEVSDCMIWIGYVNPKGYGTFRGDTETRAHRQSHSWFKFLIPSDLQIDHICQNRRCVNPDHLEAVTSKVNNYRIPNYFGKRTHCRNGHPYDKVNTYIRPDGKGRECRTCRKLLPNIEEGGPSSNGAV